MDFSTTVEPRKLGRKARRNANRKALEAALAAATRTVIAVRKCTSCGCIHVTKDTLQSPAYLNLPCAPAKCGKCGKMTQSTYAWQFPLCVPPLHAATYVASRDLKPPTTGSHYYAQGSTPRFSWFELTNADNGKPVNYLTRH